MQDNTVNIDTSQSPARLTFAPVFNVAVPFIDRHVDEGRGAKIAIRTADGDVTFDLIEKLFRGVDVVVLACVGTTDDHDDRLPFVAPDHLVADGRLQFCAVLFDPLRQIDRLKQGHGDLLSLADRIRRIPQQARVVECRLMSDA